MAAREWLERSDALAWQARHNVGDARSVSLISRLRSLRWLAYIAGAAALAMGAARMLRLF
jgi:hypothetical protein